MPSLIIGRSIKEWARLFGCAYCILAPISRPDLASKIEEEMLPLFGASVPCRKRGFAQASLVHSPPKGIMGKKHNSAFYELGAIAHDKARLAIANALR